MPFKFTLQTIICAPYLCWAEDPCKPWLLSDTEMNCADTEATQTKGLDGLNSESLKRYNKYKKWS